MPEGEGRRRARALVRTLGCVVVGGALVVAAIGAVTGIAALAVLGLVVVAEETHEFAVVASVLRIDRAPVSRRVMPTRLVTRSSTALERATSIA